MSYEWKDMTSILNFGLESQRNIADLNKVASEIIKQRNYDDVVNNVKELLVIADAATGEETMELVKKERCLDKLEAEFSRTHVEIMKECKLLEELRHANEAYIQKITEEIAEAEDAIKNKTLRASKQLDWKALENVLRKRITELHTSKTVAESFSAQIKLAEENGAAMADKIWNSTVTILPLLRGRISMETGKTVISQAKKLISDVMK